MSELIREALRRYQQEKRWENIVRFQTKAKARGIRESDVVPMIKRWRKERRSALPAQGSGHRSMRMFSRALYRPSPGAQWGQCDRTGRSLRAGVPSAPTHDFGRSTSAAWSVEG
jgi:hypothetical protein